MNLYGMSMTGSAVRPASPKGVIRLSSEKETLQHYGVPGQKWGVITKEYEPVAVDHRKMRRGQESSSEQRPIYKVQGTRFKYHSKELAERRARIEKKLKTASYIAAAAIGLFIAYKSLRYVQVKKAKAYAGILNNFLKRNPTASFKTAAGQQTILRGMNIAKENSRYLNTKGTISYLKRNGMALKKDQALRIYKARHTMKKLATAKVGSRAYKRAILKGAKYIRGVVT